MCAVYAWRILVRSGGHAYFSRFYAFPFAPNPIYMLSILKRIEEEKSTQKLPELTHKLHSLSSMPESARNRNVPRRRLVWTRSSARSYSEPEELKERVLCGGTRKLRILYFAILQARFWVAPDLALPRSVKHWSLTTLREKLIKIGAIVVRHAKYVTFQLAEVAVPRELFAAILDRIQRFGASPLVQRG